MTQKQIITDVLDTLKQERERLRVKESPEPTPYEWAYSAYLNLSITLKAHPEQGRQRQCFIEQIGKLLRAVELIDKDTTKIAGRKPDPHEGRA